MDAENAEKAVPEPGSPKTLVRAKVIQMEKQEERQTPSLKLTVRP